MVCACAEAQGIMKNTETAIWGPWTVYCLIRVGAIESLGRQDEVQSQRKGLDALVAHRDWSEVGLVFFFFLTLCFRVFFRFLCGCACAGLSSLVVQVNSSGCSRHRIMLIACCRAAACVGRDDAELLAWLPLQRARFPRNHQWHHHWCHVRTATCRACDEQRQSPHER